MAKSKARDIGMGRWSDAAIRRQLRLHRAGEPSQTEDSTVKRPPVLAKCEGHFVWLGRQAAFVGRQDGRLPGGGRHYAVCTSQAKRFDSVEAARAAVEALAGDALVMYAYASNGPLYIVGGEPQGGACR
ncbi:hypothetical protein PIN31009_02266 [Pandoraea iniqua]|nr:hypothetical protein PIN31009_02266 [Pandoraea iniqua]